VVEEVLLEAQRNEITEYYVYKRLAELAKGPTRDLLLKIAQEEFEHYQKFRDLTGKELSPDWGKVKKYTLLAKLLGLTFVIKLMEKGEEEVQRKYAKLVDKYPVIAEILEDEKGHERELENAVQDEISAHIGSIVLGLNDALVEMTGALVGLTFALKEANLISLSALVVGIAAALSMAASEYLSRRAEGDPNPLKAAIYTGIAYITVVILLVAPFFLIKIPTAALGISLMISVLLVTFVSYYISVIHERDFREELRIMLTLSLGVAFISFLIGNALRAVLGVEV